ncbi:hypothetical protein BpHYR1_000830 [Brachionus plicatilis]|uniref:Uncharacterized protein n=1 Tax=Brachionus plicatilis TaxID=10195 RepID=A0A3M7PKV8_BRAPC|nr:hypothetical protein BpHYR1_000830 [Brachionus plicatilis]
MYQLIQTLYHPNKVSAKTLQVCKTLNVLQRLYLGGTKFVSADTFAEQFLGNYLLWKNGEKIDKATTYDNVIMITNFKLSILPCFIHSINLRYV